MDLDRLPQFMRQQLPRVSDLLRVMSEQIENTYIADMQGNDVPSRLQEDETTESGSGSRKLDHPMEDFYESTISNGHADGRCIKNGGIMRFAAGSLQPGEVEILSPLELPTARDNRDNFPDEDDSTFVARCWGIYHEVVEAECSGDSVSSLRLPFEATYGMHTVPNKVYTNGGKIVRKCRNWLKGSRGKFTWISHCWNSIGG
jgi:hypothetical protein